MEPVSYVVVFPTIFSKNSIPTLIINIKKILTVQNQQFKLVKRDGDVILVDANDPVFASSAINLLFGIEKIAIARQASNDFEELVSEISSVGGKLLLRGEKFLVKVEGVSKGFVPKDVELAATSDIIEKRSSLGASPGTELNYDKLLYTYLTRKNAYICIFLDSGNGGIPFKSDIHDAVCCIYDELSAVSCYETIKQGFNPKIVVCYKKKSELIGLAKMVNRMLPRLLREDVVVEVLHIKTNSAGKDGYLRLASLILQVMINEAESCGIPRVSIPASTMVFSAKIVDGMAERVFKSNKVPILPLNGLDAGVFADLRELGLERNTRKIAKLFSQNPSGAVDFAKEPDAVKSRQKVSLKVGPNNVHDFLDSLDIH